MYIDVSAISDAIWNNDSGSTPAAMGTLRNELFKLVKLLKENGCYPSKKKKI